MKAVNLSPRDYALALKRAYTTEFAGNIRTVRHSAAKAWAEDYPEIWKEYLRRAKHG